MISGSQLLSDTCHLPVSTGLTRLPCAGGTDVPDARLSQVQDVRPTVSHLLMGHELAGIETHYLRDAHNLDEIKEIINQAFKNFEIKIIE